MKSHNITNKSSYNDNVNKKCIKLNVDQESREDAQHIFKNFTHKIDRLESNNLEPNLKQLSTNIANLKCKFTELEVCNNDFTQFYEILCYSGNLKKLLLCNNIMKSLPNEITYFQNLNILNLSHNQLTELPDNLSNLKHLELLDLSYNKLRNLPISYGKLQRLQYLDISGNNIKYFPKCITIGMRTLKYLYISENQNIRINIIPYSKYLEIFHAKNNKNCGKFPDWILTQKFFNLKECNLDGTKFDIFSFVGKKRDLCITNFSMSCSNLTITILEKIIENMVKLEKINVGNQQINHYGNIFNNIPIHKLKNPKIIKELNFSKTCLPLVPNIINQLHNLKKLDLSFNYISWFPNEFCELNVLEYLNISGNGLVMLPKNFGNLKLLRELRAENNTLTKLPYSFKDLQNLRFVDFYNNMFEEFPNELYEIKSLQGLDLEQNFFATEKIKINEFSYSTFYETYSSLVESNPENKSRCFGRKKESSIKSDDCDISNKCSCSSDDEENENINIYNHDNEENWDSVTDTDDEFEPGLERNYNDLSTNYTLDVSNGFCPADWHSKKVTVEVASMLKYGSLPIFHIVQGQFDDA